ncbi:MAG: FecR domain-containing protein, partial [Bacteroidota bacterium]|nr:FecR domain-containing protein [Bacteroidota bacterium]
ETDEGEEKLLSSLLQQNEDFKKEYEILMELWQDVEYRKKDFNKERILQLIDRQIKQEQKSSSFSFVSFLKYAAIFIAFLSLISILQHKLSFEKISIPENGNISQVSLPDQTQVTLNKGSELCFYKRSFLGFFNRNVNLKGEAFFDVSKSETARFVVQTNHFDVRVFGTKFNVRTLPGQTSLVLTEGSVKVNGFAEKPAIERMVEPGELISYSDYDHSIVQHKVNTKIYTIWKNKKLHFDNFSLDDLAQIFDLHYNKKLIVKNRNIESIHLGGSAPGDNLDLIIEALSEIFHTHILQYKDSIIIQ